MWTRERVEKNVTGFSRKEIQTFILTHSLCRNPAKISYYLSRDKEYYDIKCNVCDKILTVYNQGDNYARRCLQTS